MWRVVEEVEEMGVEVVEDMADDMGRMSLWP